MTEGTRAQMYKMIENATTKITGCNSELDLIRSTRKEKLFGLVKVCFDNIIDTHNLKVNTSGGGEYFTFKTQTNNDIFNMSFRRSNWLEEDYDEINTNVYGTSCSDDAELERLVILGKFGSMILKMKKELLESYNLIYQYNREKLNHYSKLKTSLIEQKNKLVTSLASIEMESMVEKGLTDGFEYDEPITIWINNDTSIRNVKYLKLISFTPSGKSANIELKVDGASHSYEFKNVRVRFLERYYN